MKYQKFPEGMPAAGRLLFGSRYDSSGCLLWQRAVLTARMGYGVLNYGGKVVYAHRLSYEVFKGPIPEGMLVCHSCDVPACINPDHLWLGTQKENVLDCCKKGRNSRNAGEAHSRLKLTDAEAVLIHDDPRDALTISKEYGITRSHVYHIKARKTRTYLWS